MSYMNCKELKSCFENISLMSADPSAKPGLTEHIAECPKCSRFIEGQKDLLASLALLRESGPSPSAALDEIALTNYRKQVAGLRVSAALAIAPKPRSRSSLRWVFGLAAAMALVTILLWPRKQPGVAIQPAIPSPTISSMQLDPAAHNTPVRPKPVGERKSKGAPNRTQAAVSSASMGDSIPEGFRSLMYCDELSCGGAMDVLRIELQPSDAGLIAAAPQSGSVVSADVLVGADGVARGIRIVR
jgi:hypothetical protein